MLKAAATHYAAHRGSCTGNNKHRTGAALVAALVHATPSKEQEWARTRTAEKVNKKMKNMRSRSVNVSEAELHWNESGAE